MLQAAAATAMKMPNLKIMEIWNGREGLATLFRYESTRGGQPTTITWRGTWEFDLRPPVIQAWETVTLKYCGHRPVIVKELLDVAIKSHGDAIHYLRPLNLIIRPVSLQQILIEHRIREGGKYN
jgi:hypothetical protein